MKLRIQVLLVVSSVILLAGAGIGSLSLVLAIPGIIQFDLILYLALGLILMLLIALPSFALQLFELAVDHLIAVLLLGLSSTAGAWYLADAIIGWSCLTFGAGVLTLQGYRLFDGVALIGVVAGWVIALVVLISDRFYIPR